jgi:membrane-associated protease RseP (regulator of RpoE activity)
MGTVLFVVGVLLAAFGIGASIALHEIGHLVPAKRFGVRVTQYMVGFGPTLWSRHRGETEYGVKWIPLGGYIRMIGMFPPPKGAPEGTAGAGTTGRFSALAESARSQAWEEVRPGDEDRLFYRLPVRRKVVIMMGGPTMNLMISAVLFTVLLVGVGIPTPTTELARIAPCVPSAMSSQAAAEQALQNPGSSTADCGTADPESPAQAAGLAAGDTIVAVNGAAVTTWSEVTDVTRDSAGQTVTLTVADPQGAQRVVQVPVATVYRPHYDDDGLPTDTIETVGYLGIVPLAQYVPQPLTAVPARMWELSVRSAEALLSLPVRVVQLAGDLVAGEERDPNSPLSVVGVGRLSGEVAAADEPLKSKAALLLGLMASLNLFLFLFNLVPLLPLDGGHVAGALWEGLRRWIAKLRRLPDPGPVDVARAMPVAYAVAGLMLVMGSVVILADLVNPITLGL